MRLPLGLLRAPRMEVRAQGMVQMQAQLKDRGLAALRQEATPLEATVEAVESAVGEEIYNKPSAACPRQPSPTYRKAMR